MAAGSSGSRSWEGWAPVDPDLLVRDAPDGPDGSDDEEPDIDWKSLSAGDAADYLVDYIVTLKLEGKLKATHACTLAFFAHKAGIHNDRLKAISSPPSASGGTASDKFDRALGTKPRDASHYHIGMGIKGRFEFQRSWSYVPTVPPHEALIEELAETPGNLDGFRTARRFGELPSLYSNHPVVVANPGIDVLPISIYCDGVSFGRTETCLAFWVHFLLSPKSHLVAVVRKSEMCNCGCRGWCTVRPIWEMIRWSCLAMQQGTWPSDRHDKLPWRDSDKTRKVLCGEGLGFVAIPLFMKGDWSEYVNTLANGTLERQARSMSDVFL